MNENENETWAHPKGCVYYESALMMLLKSTDEQAGQAIKAAAAYFLFGEDTQLEDDTANIILVALHLDTERSLERYRKSCEKNRRRSKAGQAMETDEICVLPERAEQPCGSTPNSAVQPSIPGEWNGTE